MNGQTKNVDAELIAKIASLAEQRGWNQEDFARKSGLSRLTVRRILLRQEGARLHNRTISRCADALGVSVANLRTLPLDSLLSGRQMKAAFDIDPATRKLYEQAMQPELKAWMERNPERAAQLSEDEKDELFSLQGTGGPLTQVGVEHFVHLAERKRRLIQHVHAIAGTEYLETLEKLVELMYEKIQPYPDRR